MTGSCPDVVATLAEQSGPSEELGIVLGGVLKVIRAWSQSGDDAAHLPMLFGRTIE